MLVEAIHRVVGDDVATSAPQLGNEPDVATHDGQSHVEPLLRGTTLLRADDRWCPDAQLDARGAQLVVERTYSRDRWRGMPQEGVEDDGRCARGGGAARIVEGEDGGDEVEGGRCRFFDSRFALAQNDKCAVDQFAPIGDGGHPHPVATLKQLIRCLLAQMIERADRKKERVGQGGTVEITEDERRFAEPAELLAQRGRIERASSCGRQVDVRAHGDLLSIGGEDGLQR